MKNLNVSHNLPNTPIITYQEGKGNNNTTVMVNVSKNSTTNTHILELAPEAIPA